MQLPSVLVVLVTVAGALAAPAVDRATPLQRRQNAGFIASAAETAFNDIRDQANGFIIIANSLSGWQGTQFTAARTDLGTFHQSIVTALNAVNSLGVLLQNAGATYQAQEAAIDAIF